ncbi:MAG: hypothetical protein M3328_16470, partial [Chloroflexota bacterium]|nr:hypothetical protein [Chloroflexota bacterium]
MSNTRNRLYLLMVILFSLLPATGVQALDAGTSYMAETYRWRAAEGQFAAWQRERTSLVSAGVLQLDPQAGSGVTERYGAGRYRRASSFVGEATGPAVTTSFPFSEAVPSWNATTPPGTWIEVYLRARIGSRWTGWYNMGVWASDDAVARHSVGGQADADAYVDVDTLKIGARGKPLNATAYQLKLRLFSKSREALPSVTNAAVVVSTSPAAPARLVPGNPALWGKALPVPECSQMVYPDG